MGPNPTQPNPCGLGWTPVISWVGLDKKNSSTCPMHTPISAHPYLQQVLDSLHYLT